jgi:hypothetical protein
MAQAEILFTRANGQPDFIAFDAVTDEDHSADAELSDYAVEEGVDVSDHHRPNPKTVTLSVVVSNTPLEAPQSQVVAQPQALKFTADAPKPVATDRRFSVPPGNLATVTIVGPFSVSIPMPFGYQGNIQVQQPGASEAMAGVFQGFDTAFDRVQAVSDVIHEIIDNSLICTVITDRRTYADMLVVGFSDPVKQQGVMIARLTLRSARFANTLRAAAPETDVPRTRAQQSLGNQSATPTTDGWATHALEMNDGYTLSPGF